MAVFSIDCAYVGDSIALGTGRADRGCARYAVEGLWTREIVQRFKGKQGKDVTIISMGTNGPRDPANRGNMAELRANIHSASVLWIVPFNQQAAADVLAVAGMFGDKVVYLRGFGTNDGLHPKSYSATARRVRAALAEKSPVD